MAITLVQSAHSTSTSVTFSAPTTGGNMVLAAFGADPEGTLTGVTLGGSAGNFAQVITARGTTNLATAWTWADPDCTAGLSSVAVAYSGGVAAGTAYTVALEFTDVAVTDRASGQGSPDSGQTLWSSGTTAKTRVAAEVWVGNACGPALRSGQDEPPPGAPWTTVFNPPLDGNSAAAIAYQIVSSAGSAAYASAGSTGSLDWAATVATFAASLPPPPAVVPGGDAVAALRAAGVLR